MLIDVVVENSSSSRTKRILILKCDYCSEIFRRKYSKCFLQKKLHFDSMNCKNQANRKGGVLFQLSVETCREKYGTDYPNQSDFIKQKKIETCRERFGTDYSISSEEVRQKSVQTFLNRYGKTSYLSTDECRNSLENSSLERWGVKHPSQSEEIKEKKRQSSLLRYGVDNISQSQIVKDAKIKTSQFKYGVDNPFQSHELMKKFDRSSAYKRRIQSMQKNNSFQKSKEEDKIYSLLCLYFGDEFVERQALVNKKWPIDFYIKSYNTYIQFDGQYWHGLDRPIEVISEHKTKQDVVIHKKWLTDREQDLWFKNHKIKLVRITEKDLNFERLNQIFDDIKQNL